MIRLKAFMYRPSLIDRDPQSPPDDAYISSLYTTLRQGQHEASLDFATSMSSLELWHRVTWRGQNQGAFRVILEGS